MALPEIASHLPHNIHVPGLRSVREHWKSLTAAGLTISAGIFALHQVLTTHNPEGLDQASRPGANEPVKPSDPGSASGITPVFPQSPDNPSVYPSSGTGPDNPPKPEAEIKPCKILPDKYCSTGRLVEKEIINPLNQQKVIMRYVEFDIKEAGIEIYSPIDGQAGSVPRPDTNDFSVSIKNLQDPNRLTYSVDGGIKPTKPGEIKAGSIIGHSDGRPIKFMVSSINGKDLAYPLGKLQEVVPSIVGQTTEISQGPKISTDPALLVDRFQ